MRSRAATIVRRCTAWAVCLAALGAATTVALRAVDTDLPGPFPGGDARFSAMLADGAEQTGVIQASATSAPGPITAGDTGARQRHTGDDD